MGNWNRHFVRVGSDGNMGIYDQKGNRFIRESIGSDNLPAQIVFIPNSTDNNGTIVPPENNSIGFMSSNYTRINPNTAMVLNLGSIAAGYIQQDFSYPFNIYQANTILKNTFQRYNGISGALNSFSTMSGSPDLRIGVTAADASPITIFSSTASGTRYEVKARILATAGISATYTITWTEGGAARTVALTVTAAGTEYHDNFVIAPDAGTNITAQITSLTSSTVNVDAIVSVLG